jgi:hypothetical protein
VTTGFSSGTPEVRGGPGAHDVVHDGDPLALNPGREHRREVVASRVHAVRAGCRYPFRERKLNAQRGRGSLSQEGAANERPADAGHIV